MTAEGIVTVEVSLCLDLDSAVSSGGLDKILTPRPSETPSQPRSRSYFQSVIVSKVVKPDGVRDNARYGCSIMERIITAIILVNIEITIIQTIIF